MVFGTTHDEEHIACVKLQVDLLVDNLLAFLAVVLTTQRLSGIFVGAILGLKTQDHAINFLTVSEKTTSRRNFLSVTPSVVSVIPMIEFTLRVLSNFTY